MSNQAVAGPPQETIELASGPVTFYVAGAGPDLLLLHHDVGPIGWTEFHEQLATHFRVIAPDMPGFGLSPRADWARHPRDLAAMMLAFARRMELKRYTLAGTGLGGWVAAEMASFAWPEMANLALIAAAGMRPDDGFILDQVLEEPAAYLVAGFADEAARDRYFPDPRGRSLRGPLEVARESVARVSWKPYMYSYELPETLREMPLPTAVVWGEADRVIPLECARHFAAVLPQCEVSVLPGAGHFVELERPVEVAGIVRALAGVVS